MKKKTRSLTSVTMMINESDIREAFDIPKNASVRFNVPTGGDYSGMSIDISDTSPVVVSWEKEEEY